MQINGNILIISSGNEEKIAKLCFNVNLYKYEDVNGIRCAQSFNKEC